MITHPTPSANLDDDKPCAAPREQIVQGAMRHVSAEGCQLALSGPSVAIGERLAFRLGETEIAGTIRWVVDERAGFAFDRRLDTDALAQASKDGARLRAMVLLARLEPALPC